MPDPRIDAVTIDLIALEAIVRAVAHDQDTRSPAALAELLVLAAAEIKRIRTCPTFSGANRDELCSVLDSWIEDLKAQTSTEDGATD